MEWWLDSSIVRCMLRLNRKIAVYDLLSRHCKHGSTAKTCAIFACLLLACTKCHDLFTHEASQSKYCACLCAAGNEVDFLYSAFSDVKMLRYNSYELVPNIVRVILSNTCQKAKTISIFVACFSRPSELRWLAHIDVGEPPFQEP
jgi:hypothetical protein